MNLSEFDYELPPERIAQRPLAERDASRMLLLDRTSGAWEDRHFREFPELLRGDELIVVQQCPRDAGAPVRAPLRSYSDGAGAATIPRAKNFCSAPIEVLLVRQLAPDTWETLVRPGRKVPTGERIVFGEGELEGARRRARRHTDCAWCDLRRRMASTKRSDASGTFRCRPTSSAWTSLPTASATRPYSQSGESRLRRRRRDCISRPRFSGESRERGIEIAEITLDVGLGTFEPVRTERLEDHKIHAEAYEISEATAAAVARARRDNRPVLAIGTTVVRALEDAAQKSGSPAEPVAHGKLEAEIFLYPGKTFRAVDQLLTNFHVPRSSLLAMVAAFAGRENVLRAYRHAVESGYRFYSYGDCMLIR